MRVVGPSREFVEWEQSKLVRSRQAAAEDDSRMIIGGVRPSFITLPQSSVNVHEYEPLTLRCVVDGHPKPTGFIDHISNKEVNR